MKRIIFNILLCGLLSSHVLAQTNTEFWFAVPYIDKTHDSDGDNAADKGPNYFRISTGLSAAVVNFYYFPGGVQTLLHSESVGSNSVGTVTLGKTGQDIDLALVEADQYSTILKRGIYIESDLPVNIYYEIGSYNNTEIFTLKGAEALGTTFYPLIQTRYPNKNVTSGGCSGWALDSWTTVDIVATEDNTSVTISIPTTSSGGTNDIYEYKSNTATQNASKIFKQKATSAPNATLMGATHFEYDWSVPTLWTQKTLEVWKNGVLQSSSLQPKIWNDTTAANICCYCVGVYTINDGWENSAAGKHVILTYFQEQFHLGYTTLAAITNATVLDSTVTVPTSISFSGFTTTTITMHKGEIYSIKSASQGTKKPISGIKITSTKNIAVSVKDDSAQDGDCAGSIAADVIGDQNIPITKAGSKYIVPDFNTGNVNADQTLIIRALENGTVIKINGVTIITLNEGEMYEYTSFSRNDSYKLISANHPFLCMQISGYVTNGTDTELAGATLPSVDQCTGSSVVSFTRPQVTSFKFILLSHTNSAGTFFYKEGAGSWTGFNPTWTGIDTDGDAVSDLYYTVNPFTVNQGSNYMVKNTSTTFHLGYIHQVESGGSKGALYGYFSGFNTPEIRVKAKDIGGGNFQLYATGGVDASYSWKLIKPTPAGTDCANDYHLSVCSASQTTVVNGGTMNYGYYRYQCDATHPCLGTVISGIKDVYIPPTTGPGGQKNNMVIWFKANAGVCNNAGGVLANVGDPVLRWNNYGDMSNNALKAGTSNPLFASNYINYNPAVLFANGDTEYFNVDLSYLNNTSYSMFAVVRRDNANTKSYVLGTQQTGLNAGLHFGYRDDLDATVAQYGNDLDVTVKSYNNPVAPSIIHGSLDNANGKIIRELKNSLFFSNTNAAITQLNSTGQGVLGRGYDGEGFEGDIAEVVAYAQTFTAAQVNKIYSYLAIKYGISISQTPATNYTASDGTLIWKSSTAGSYKYDIAGIGRDDLSALYQKQSASANTDDILKIGIGAIATTNALNGNTISSDKLFLAWANNNVANSASGIVDLPATIQARNGRVWKIHEINGDIGACEIRFNLSNMGAIVTANLRLLLDADGVFSNATISAATATNNGDGSYSFSGINLSDGQYITIGSINSTTTPLIPVSIPVSGVGINTIFIHSSAELHIVSDAAIAPKKQGVLIPSLTTAQMNAIANPPQSLLIYNTSYSRYMYNAGTETAKAWQFVGEVTKNTSTQLSTGTGLYLGELRFNTTTKTMFYWDGTDWQEIKNTGNVTP